MAESGRRAVKRKSTEMRSENINTFHPAYASAILALSEVQQSAQAYGFKKDSDI